MVEVVRRILVAAIAVTLGTGALSVAAAAVPSEPARSTGATKGVVAVVEDAPVCTAEQIEAGAGPGGAATAGATIVTFTLVDPRCRS